MSKIDEKTGVPLGWVISLFGTGIGVTVVGTFWVASVNTRLERIEAHLGIKPYEVKTGALIPEAVAAPIEPKVKR